MSTITNCYSQTTLNAGDIAIIGYNFDNPDEFSFVCLTSISSSTVIYFTDNGWKSDNTFRANEGIHTWTASTSYSIGDVVNVTTSGPALSSSGDQILAYQGTNGSPVFIFAINSEGSGVWQSNATSASTSALPQGLTNGANAISFNETDNAYYNGPTSGGSTSEILNAICNTTNWTSSNSRTNMDASDNAPSAFIINGGSATTPSAPTITSIDNGSGQVTINFTAGSDGGATITDFEYSIDGGSNFTSMGTTSSPYIISSLVNGTDYDIQIRAVNSEGAGTASATEVGSPFATTTPSAPTISSIENGEGQVTVNFTAGSDGGSTITDFEYSIDGGSNFTSAGTTSSPYVISGLTNGTNYDIQIRAVNSEGAGAASNTAVGSPFANELSLSLFNSATTENFNLLASSATSSTLPTGIYLDETGSNANSTYSASTGSSNAGNTYSFGSDSDRALGGVASGSLQTSFGAKIRNETGITLNSVVISYTGESWRIGSANRIDQLDFQYSTDATGLDDGTWTDFDNLDYVNTGQATGSGSIQHTSSLNDTLTNLGVSNNGTFWIRWNDLDATGADDGMAVDDLSITAICKAGTVAVSDDYILAGNNITWTYTGSDFDSYEYQWNSDGWNAPWTTNNPQTWGADWTGNIGQTLYVRAKAVCGSESDLSTVVHTYWDNCYAEPITATVDGVSISDGGDFTINSTVEWTWEHAGSGENNGATDEGGGSGHALGYNWESIPSNNDDYYYAWNTNPQSWDGPSNPTQFSSTDRILYVQSRATGINSCTNYSAPFSITLKRPVITTTGSLSSFTVCAGSASSSQNFSVSGSYISNSTGITVTAPAGFEVSTDDSNFSGTVNVSATSGNVSSTPIYVRLASTASGSPSGNVTCSATSAVDQTVSASGTATAAPDAGTLSGTEAVCSDGTTDFDTDGDSGGTWSSADDNVATINSASGVVTAVATGSSLMTYTVSGTGACAGTDASSTRTVTVNAAATGGSLTVDKTEALSTETINWTNSGVTNGTCRYHFQWSDDNISAPTGSWTPWDITENQSWATSSAGSNMNRTLWVKTIITASNTGCTNVETTPVYTDVVNCKAGTTSASVSAGAVAHMPFGETITYTSGAPLDGSFERLQFQWGGTSGTWSDWSTNNPTNYTTDINAGQTLYVRAKITGADAGSGGCEDYSNIIQTLLVDCPNAVSANAGSDIDLCSGSTVDFSGSGSGSTSGSNVSSYAWSPNTEISSTSSATPTISATSTRTYTLTNTHDNGCTSTDDIVVTVADGPSITTATDLTAAANTCGETELTISHSGTGGNGQWTYSGGLVSYNNSNATDATINVTPQPSDVNTDITMTWTVGAGEVCDGAITTKTIRFNQPTSISSPDNYCYLWGGLTSADNATGSNWYKWDATKSMWARQSVAPSTSTDKLHVLTTDNNCIHASNTVTLGTTTLASLNVGSGASMSLGSGTVTLNGDLTNAGTINEGSGTVSLTAAGDQTLSGGGTTNFNNLNLNKTSDNLVLSSPATIKGTLTMNKGNINNGSIV
ncbi:fibronectin type III domain-containing protein [Crocinitomicaceae bacterium]|nr:fibronectin type III domain-containing protein [Crocinitomicaceae bacterium]